jgi:hypothetical protein
MSRKEASMLLESSRRSHKILALLTMLVLAVAALGFAVKTKERIFKDGHTAPREGPRRIEPRPFPQRYRPTGVGL